LIKQKFWLQKNKSVELQKIKDFVGNLILRILTLRILTWRILTWRKFSITDLNMADFNVAEI